MAPAGAVRGCASLLPGAALALVLLLGAGSSMATQHYPPAEGCPNRAQKQTYCPRYFRRMARDSPWEPFNVNAPFSSPSQPIGPSGPTVGQLLNAERYYLDELQEHPCISNPASCRLSAQGSLQCSGDGMMYMDDAFLEVLQWTQMIPGSPAACGHGNREFSFFVRPTDRGVVSDAPSLERVMLVFAAGGICWDAASCGDSEERLMGSGNNEWSAPHGQSPEVPQRLLTFLWQSQNMASKPGILDTDSYPEYDSVIIPDCTGDMNIGNRSYTYDAHNNKTCITAHHRGGINTGMAIDWVLNPRNAKRLKEVVLVATGFNDIGQNRAFGAHGPAFWAAYIQKKVPNVVVRVVTEQSLGLHGPMWSKVMEADPWGTLQLHEPGSTSPLLPAPSEWSFSHDDMTSYYEIAAKHTPSLAFADVASMHDPSQMSFFEHFGGHRRQCCVDGCSCQSGGDNSLETGQLDWIKTVKIAVLQRHQRLGENYRSWLSHVPVRYYMLMTFDQLQAYMRLIGATEWDSPSSKISEICPRVQGSTSCPKTEDTCSGHQTEEACLSADFCSWAASAADAESFECVQKYPSPSILAQFVRMFGESKIKLDGLGHIESDNLPGRTYEERVFGNFTCRGCLDGIPGGSDPADEKCNATYTEGETLFTIAPKYNTDWMLLWSLNGGDSPDTGAKPGVPYRFAHQHVVQEGETVESIARMLATTPEAITNLNRNRITNFARPSAVGAGDTICVLPSFMDVRDRYGNYICPANVKHTGEPHAN